MSTLRLLSRVFWSVVAGAVLAASPALAQPDLIATKTNDTGGVATVGVPFTWTIVVENIGNADYEIQATFSIFRDELPNVDISYGAVNVTSSGMTGSVSCTINNSFRLDCFTQSFVRLAPGGHLTMSFPATASAAGQQVNPRAGQLCRADPGSNDVESNESNNDCSDTVAVTTGVSGPDLTASKNNSVGGVTEVAQGEFEWTIDVANGGDGDATFNNGETILRDQLPSSGLSYGTPTLSNQTGLSGSGSITCSIVSSSLTCLASGGTVTLAAATGGFRVTIPTTPTTAGTFTNPRSGGTCAVNPDGDVTEGDTTNNTCSDSVTVNGSPDLIATKSSDVGGNAVIDTPFTWSIEVENVGTATYQISATFNILRDWLPTSGATYGAVSLSSSGMTGSLSCTIDGSSILSCFTQSNITLPVGASFTVSFPVTPTAAGSLVNPRSGGLCRADPGNNDRELDESNNDCSETVVVGTGAVGPDLSVDKSNDTGGATELADGPWNWSLQVANGGAEGATFPAGATLLTDALPSSGLSYGTPVAGGLTGVSGTGTIACSISGSDLSCIASGGTVILAASGEFTVTVPTTPLTAGTYANPRSGGACAVDPADAITEGDETNNACSDTVIVAASPDLIATKSNDVGGAGTLGVPFTWTLEIENIGQAAYHAPATLSFFQDDLPNSGMTYGAVQVSSSGVTGTMSCAINASSSLSCETTSNVAIAPSGRLTVSFSATPTTTGVFANPRSPGVCRADANRLDAEVDETNNDCSDTVTVTPEAALTLSKSDGPDPAVAGAALTYTLEAGNAGPNAAESVQVFDLLPAGTTFDVAGSDNSCNPPADLLGLRADLDQAQVTPPSGSAATGTATLFLDTTTHLLRFVLAVSGMTDNLTGASLRLADGTLVHTLFEGSPTFDDANPLTGWVQLTPAEATALQAAGSHRIRLETDADPSGAIAGTPAVSLEAPVVCDLGTIAASSTTSVQVVVHTGAGQAGASLANTAFVDAATRDPDEVALPAGALRGAQATASTTVVASTDLALQKSDSPDPVTAGQNLTYTLTVTNNGPSNSTGSTITDPLPAGVTFSSSPDGCTEAAGTVSCPIAALGVGAASSVSFTVTVGAAVTGSLTNTATVTANEADPTAANDSDIVTTPVAAVADLGLTKDDNPDTAVAGRSLTYSLTVTNHGPSSSTGGTVTDPLPAGTTFASSPDDCTEAAGTVACPVGALGVDAAESLSFTVNVDPGVTASLVNIATVSGNETDPNTVNDAATTTTPVAAEADLALTKADSPDPVTAGEALVYTLTVTNLGPSDSTGSTVTDPLPAGTAFASSPDGCTEADGTVSCSIGALASGANRSVQFTVDVAASASGPLATTATVVGQETDANADNDSAGATTAVERHADLQITQSDAPDPSTAGTALTYTLMPSNAGPSDDPETVTVTDVLPAGVSFDAATGTGWTCVEAAGTVTCTRPGLPVGPAPPIEVAVTVDAATTGPLTNSVSITSPTPDPDTGANDTGVTESTAVVTEADLALSKLSSADPVVGSTFDYTLRVTNAGPSDARNVVVTDILPGALDFEASATCSEAAGTVTCLFGTLAAGDSAEQTFTVSLLPPLPPTVTNTADVSSDEADPNPTDNSDTEHTSLDAVPPAVLGVDTRPDTGDGVLDVCETANVGIDRLLILFSESMNDPPGDGDPSDITNPANTLLIAPGADRSFQTTDCGGLAGDDMSIAPTAITYDEASRTATLAFTSALPDDLYRLLICPDVTDLAGNPLDGDGDGSGGDDFVRSFRVDAENLLANGHFDCDLAGWQTLSTHPTEITWSAEDHEGSGDSGSVQVLNLTASSSFWVGQCADLPAPHVLHRLETRTRIDVAPDVIHAVSGGCTFFDQARCSGDELGTVAATGTGKDTEGVWQPMSLELLPPDGALSAHCSFLFETPRGVSFDAHLDFLSLTADSFLFADGFESGNTSSWSFTMQP